MTVVGKPRWPSTRQVRWCGCRSVVRLCLWHGPSHWQRPGLWCARVGWRLARAVNHKHLTCFNEPANHDRQANSGWVVRCLDHGRAECTSGAWYQSLVVRRVAASLTWKPAKRPSPHMRGGMAKLPIMGQKFAEGAQVWYTPTNRSTATMTAPNRLFMVVWQSNVSAAYKVNRTKRRAGCVGAGCTQS